MHIAKYQGNFIQSKAIIQLGNKYGQKWQEVEGMKVLKSPGYSSWFPFIEFKQREALVAKGYIWWVPILSNRLKYITFSFLYMSRLMIPLNLITCMPNYA